MPLKYLEKVSSTMIYIRENNSEFQENYSGVYTFDQYAGKGQRGSSWDSNAGKNIAVTFCLNSQIIKAEDLSCRIALSLVELFKNLAFKNVAIKWPNDVLIEGKKVCGVLIEKISSQYIIGIGININQEKFSVERASSLFNIEPKEYDKVSVVKSLMAVTRQKIEKESTFSEILAEYNSLLFGKDEVRGFRIAGNNYSGIVRNVDEQGHLEVDIDGEGLRKFKTKEIEFVY